MPNPEEFFISQSERAYEILLNKIATCELPPGTLLNEREAAAELSMSRTPFRQALHRLALEGLVVTIPKRGVYVTLLDFKNLEDNVAVRQALEVEIIQQIIRNRLPVDHTEIRRQISEMREAAERDDAMSFLAADEHFHVEIMAAAGNLAALEAVKRTWIHLNRARYLLPPNAKARREALSEHREIVVALKAQDAKAAALAVRKHMAESLRRLEKMKAGIPSAFVGLDGQAVPSSARTRTVTKVLVNS